MRRPVALMLALAACLALGLAGCKIRGQDPPTWHLEDLTSIDTAIGQNWALLDVDAAGWAVGWKIVRVVDIYTERPLVLRRVGDQWEEEDLGSFATLEGGLGGVGVAPNGDVWCVGSAGPEGGEPLVLVKTGGAWTRLEEPVEPGWPSGLADVAFEDAHNTYVVGEDAVLLFVDRAWEDIYDAPEGTAMMFYAIDWADAGYAAGGWEGGAVISESTTDPPFSSNVISGLYLGGELEGIDLLSDGTGWAVGFYGGGSTGERTLIVRREGGSWAEDTDFKDTFLSDINLMDVATLSETRAFAVGQDDASLFGAVLSYVADRTVEMDGQTVPRPWDYETAAMDLVDDTNPLGWQLMGIDASSETRAFAAGWGAKQNEALFGIILRYE